MRAVPGWRKRRRQARRRIAKEAGTTASRVTMSEWRLFLRNMKGRK